jgi:hypothetical protein
MSVKVTANSISQSVKMQSLARIFKTTLTIGVVSQLIGCNTGPDVNFEAWQEKQSSSAVQYTVDEEVKITLNWSRIGPFSRYNTRLRANAFSGLIDIYGAQTCLGKYVRDDRLSPAHGWWEIVCPDESYAAGNFRIDVQGKIQGVGTAINGEDVSFALAIPN